MVLKQIEAVVALINNLSIKGDEKDKLMLRLTQIRHQYEDEIKKANEGLKYTRELIEVSQDTLLTINQEGMITDVNRATESATGLKRSQLIGTNFVNYFTDSKKAQEGYLQAFKDSKISNYELELKHVKGKTTPVMYSASVYRDDKGTIMGLFADARDISSIKKYEHELETIQHTLQDMVTKRTSELHYMQMLLKSSLESPKNMLILALDKNYKYLYYNKAHKAAIRKAYNTEVSIGASFMNCISSRNDRSIARKNFDLAMTGVSHTTIEEFGGKKINYYESLYNPVYDENGEIIGASSFSRDVSDRINTTNQLLESEARLDLFFTQSLTGFFIMMIDKPIYWNDTVDKKAVLDYVFKHQRCTRVNQAILNQYGLTKEEFMKKTPAESFTHNLNYGKEMWRAMFDKGYLHTTSEERKADGSPIYIEGDYICMYDAQSRIIGHFGNQHDVTAQVKKQSEIEYLSNHDYLTDLYNRRYYFNQFDELDRSAFYPLGIMMLDVNGLKIINDAYGHHAGDAALVKLGNILKSIFEKKDVVARIGGDEFAVLLPNITPEKIQMYKEAIIEKVKAQQVENIELSLSVGYEIKHNIHEEIDDIMKAAENRMYRHKTTEGASVRNRAITAILKTLTDKYDNERNHSQKVSWYCRKIGEQLKLKADEVKELEQAGMFHDIGKISIPDEILNKPGRLTPEEYETIKAHAEVGYQILRAADEYSDLAIHALHHHERYDGKGYPRGLKGKDIPLFSRIIGIADAYEAMRANRPYRSRMSEEDAIKEIIRCSGSQFDPKIAKVFVEKVLKNTPF